MKKSEIYRAAIMAIVDVQLLTPANKFDVLEKLFADYSLAKFSEKQEAGNDVSMLS